MHLPDFVIEALLGAEAKALATYSETDGINVVPVSSVTVKDGKIVLVNYFFGQTLKNIESNPNVALAFWKGLTGLRVSAMATHATSGSVFDEVMAWIAETIPGRVVRGVLILEPTELFDISAGANAGKPVRR